MSEDPSWQYEPTSESAKPVAYLIRWQSGGEDVSFDTCPTDDGVSLPLYLTAPIAQTADARELLIECRTELADMLSELTNRGYKQRHIDASIEFIAKLDAAIAALQREGEK